MAQSEQTSSPAPEDNTENGRQLSSMVARVLWLVRLRWYASAALALLGAAIGIGLGNGTQGNYIIAWAVALLVYNSAIWLSLSRTIAAPSAKSAASLRRLSDLQIFADVVVLIAVMHYTGGAMNPLAALLIFEMAIAASLLPAGDAYVQVVCAAALFGGLAVLEVYSPSKLLPLVPSLPSEVVRGFRGRWTDTQILIWIGAVWAAITATMGLTVYFTTAILGRLRRINQRLADANRQLSALDLTKSRFLRISSHQLRSPLAAIHAMLSAMQEVGGLNHQQYELVLKIQARCEEIMGQVDEMMLLSTIKESAAETSDRHAVEVGPVLRESVAAFAEEARQRRIALTLDEGPAGASVSAWDDAIETIMEHLVGNALKYTPEKGSVSVDWRLEDKSARITVADTGIGIPPEQQGQLFHEFFRATNARQICCGTGLGLAIVKAIVERLGGEVRIESALGKGTSVCVKLPSSGLAAADDAPEADLGSAARDQGEATSDAGPDSESDAASHE
jgi:signal transduction histidine kinase